MTGFLSGAQQGRAPYHLVVTLNMCRCNEAPEHMATARSVERLIPAAQGYWSVYTAFWGHLPRLIAVSIVDIRDGTVMWRNGRQLLQEDEDGTKRNHEVSDQGTGRPVRGRAGRAPTAGRVTGGYGS